MYDGTFLSTDSYFNYYISKIFSCSIINISLQQRVTVGIKLAHISQQRGAAYSRDHGSAADWLHDL